MPVSTESKLRATTLLMAIGVAVAVANLYYCQPLLGLMGHNLHASERQMGFVAMLTQVGTAFGMLLFVPLGDIMERRSLTVRMCLFVAFGALLPLSLRVTRFWRSSASYLGSDAWCHTSFFPSPRISPRRARSAKSLER